MEMKKGVDHSLKEGVLCLSGELIVLYHKLIFRWQQGHLGSVLAMARAMVVRMDVIELATWRSGRTGGSAGG
jgi:hypothetical protein